MGGRKFQFDREAYTFIFLLFRVFIELTTYVVGRALMGATTEGYTLFVHLM